VTHLLCSGDEETDKMRLAEKFIQRREAQIHLVWEDWFWDSLKVKGRLDEARYNIRNPRPPPVVLRNTQPNVPDSTVPSRSNSMQAPAPEDAEDLDAEAARVNIVPDITLKVWTGLLERRGYEMEDGEIIRSPTKSQHPSRSVSPPPQQGRSGRASKATSVISAVRRINTFEAADKVPTQRALPFKRGKGASAPPENEAGPSNQSREATPKTDKPRHIFNGMLFCVLGEADTPAVRSAIQENGGTVTSEYSSPGDDVDIYLVRLIRCVAAKVLSHNADSVLSGSKLYRREQDQAVQAKYRTECWLERCLHEERVCQAEDHVSFMPLAVNLPIPGRFSVFFYLLSSDRLLEAGYLLFGLSGLDQSESCHTKRILKAFGAKPVPFSF
jgi:hypothetical protein